MLCLIEKESTFFTLDEKCRLKIKIKEFFNKLNSQFNISQDEDYNKVYFDEILIIQKEKKSITKLFHLYEGNRVRDKLTYNQLSSIIYTFEMEYDDNSYLFIKDQRNLNFNFIANINLNGIELFVLLNNTKYSLDEIEAKYPKSWKSMNEFNAKLYFMLRKILVKVKS